MKGRREEKIGRTSVGDCRKDVCRLKSRKEAIKRKLKYDFEKERIKRRMSGYHIRMSVGENINRISLNENRGITFAGKKSDECWQEVLVSTSVGENLRRASVGGNLGMVGKEKTEGSGLWVVMEMGRSFKGKISQGKVSRWQITSGVMCLHHC